MGMFDYVLYDCPNCHKELEEQSKVGDCMLNTYYLESAPASIVEGQSGYTQTCYHCNKSYHIKSKITVEVKVFPGEYKDDSTE